MRDVACKCSHVLGSHKPGWFRRIAAALGGGIPYSDFKCTLCSKCDGFTPRKPRAQKSLPFPSQETA